MGTWIEMYCPCQMNTPCFRRSLQWERGLKYLLEFNHSITILRRSLQWERGLKWTTAWK